MTSPLPSDASAEPPEFTYATYLQHVEQRFRRLRAELQGVRDVQHFRTPVQFGQDQELTEAYRVGWDIGRMYWQKGEV